MSLDLTFFSLVLSFSLGMSCVLMPCCLPALTGFVHHVTRTEKTPSRRRLLPLAGVFAIGVLAPFTFVGLAFATFGAFVRSFFQPFTYVLAAILVLMGASHILGRMFSVPIRISLGESRGFSGSFKPGIVYGLGAADCAIMILAPVFFLSLTFGNLWVNVANFVSFGLGRSLPILLSSLFIARFRTRFVTFFSQRAQATRLATGSLIMLSGCSCSLPSSRACPLKKTTRYPSLLEWLTGLGVS